MPIPADAAIITDLYELTMAASYFRRGMDGTATFELFVRDLPPERGFLVASGIEDAIDFLVDFRFDRDDVERLRGMGLFADDFLAYLPDLRFTGEVWAVEEGALVFGGEPMLRVTAPLIQAQVVETFLLNTVTFPTAVASKAARITLASEGRSYADFGLRRTHGPDAGMVVARSAYLAGAASTSNVIASVTHGIPASGTMAHSYVVSFPSEADAFRAYARDFPGRAIFLLDTYDTIRGARIAADVARELAAEGIAVQGVRLDSGDFAALSSEVRAILDDAGLPGVRIFASGDLDEHRIAALIAAGAPIDSFGVGTRLGTSMDAPALSTVYKLVEDATGPRMKLSSGKATLPGRKQVFRVERDGVLDHDVIGLHDEALPGEPLLHLALVSQERVARRDSLEAIRERCLANLARLPLPLRGLEPPLPRYDVRVSPGLQALAKATRRQVRPG